MGLGSILAEAGTKAGGQLAQHSDLLYSAGRMIGSGLIGGTAMAAGAGLINAAGGDVNAGSAFKLGFAAFAGMKGLKLYSSGNLGSFAGLGSRAFSGLAGLEKKAGLAFAGRYMNENWMKQLAKVGRSSKEGMAMLGRAALYTRLASGAVSGAALGAAVGAGYGLFSDKQTMFGGAFKGAILGAAAGAAFRQFGGGFSKLNRKYAMRAISANKPIGGAISHPAAAAVKAATVAAAAKPIKTFVDDSFVQASKAEAVKNRIRNIFNTRPARNVKTNASIANGRMSLQDSADLKAHLIAKYGNAFS
jgi:hypothetical protein